jgi:ubiquinone/menaquinone biosynthesis C-methylase UbiE
MPSFEQEGSPSFSYEAERQYYSAWPTQAKPYLHLERYLRCWMDPAEVFTGKRVLDIGAGEMTYTRLIADRFEPQNIVACELFRERMLPAYRDNQNPKLKSVAGSCFQLPFKNKSFDVAFGSGVLSQLSDLKEALIEISRVLRPGGLFVGWDPNPFNLVILYRYIVTPRSPNQFIFWPHKVRPLFRSAGYTATTRFFYARLPWARSRFLGTCVGMVARKVSHD